LVLMLCAAQGAQAFIYWPDSAATTIDRASLDGSGVQGFVSTPGGACGVAVDGAHIYWSNINGGGAGAGTIGRANLDGSAPDQSFITGASNACGLAVDGSHIYWANNVSSGSIGRANLDGSSPNQSIVSPMDHPCGVAVDGSHIYWGNRGSGSTPGVGSIGRANLDGGSPEQGFITGATHPCGVAVDGAHVYWSNLSGGTTIGRANLDGSAPDESFITGAFHPCGVAVDSSHIYWANSGAAPAIGRANLDGTGVNQGFIAGMNSCFVAVDALPLPPNAPPPNPPGPNPSPVVPGPNPSPVAPFISNARLSPATFRAASRGASLVRKVKTGTTISYRDSQAATTTFVVLKPVAGHKRGRRCVAGRKRRHQRACTRYVSVGSFKHADTAGNVTVHFTGRVKGKALKPGSYKLALTASANGKTSRTVTLSFRIVP
jgi:hypothetical protein